MEFQFSDSVTACQVKHTSKNTVQFLRNYTALKVCALNQLIKFKSNFPAKNFTH